MKENLELIPQNQLESILQRTKEGKATHHDLLSCLINSKVTLLTNAVDPKQSQIGEPLCVPDRDNKPLLALFSSPERGKSLQELHPSFRYAVEVRFQDALRLMAGKTGMALNLGWSLSLQMPPEGILELARDIVNSTSQP